MSVCFGQGGLAVQALDRVDLDVEEAARIGLQGRSGSGKTTLLHVLAGLVPPSGGTVERAVEARTALVFQSPNLLPHFTAFENVAFAVDAAGEAEPALAADALLELVGLQHKAASLPSELSGGEAQRVAIARALATTPRLLLCDEPTGHLDSDTQARVLDLLDGLQREFRFATVVATHDPEVADRLDRVVELRDGRVASSLVSV